jgi:hypothetical protein
MDIGAGLRDFARQGHFIHYLVDDLLRKICDEVAQVGGLIDVRSRARSHYFSGEEIQEATYHCQHTINNDGYFGTSSLN